MKAQRMLETSTSKREIRKASEVTNTETLGLDLQLQRLSGASLIGKLIDYVTSVH